MLLSETIQTNLATAPSLPAGPLEPDACSSISDSAPQACGLLRLGNDELALVAALCGREAPVLAHLCRALSHVWRMVRSEPSMLAQLLVHVCGEADGWWRPTYTKTPLDIMRVRGAGMAAADADAVRLLLDAGVDVHAWDEEVLRLAAQRGRAATVALALQRGADVHARGNEALRDAALHGHTDVVRVLLDAGADAQADACAGLLQRVVEEGHHATAQLLLDRGSSPTNDMLFAACERGDDAMVRLLLDAGADLHAWDGRALRAAAANGHTTTVSLLLGAGADLHAGGGGALRAALWRMHLCVLRLLLGAGAELRHTHIQGFIPSCIEAGNLELLQLLLEEGADFDKVQALSCAAGFGDIAIVQLMLEHLGEGAQGAASAALVNAAQNGRENVVVMLLPLCEAGDANVRHAFKVASGMRRPQLLQLLLQHPAVACDQACKEEALVKAASCPCDRSLAVLLPLCGADSIAVRYALQAASRHGRPRAMKLLLRHPAVVSDQACKDEALLNACCAGCEPAVAALLQAGADVRHNGSRELALYAAAATAHLPVLQVLIAHGADAAALRADAVSRLHLRLSRNCRQRPAAAYQPVVDLLKAHGASKLEVASIAERWWKPARQWRW